LNQYKKINDCIRREVNNLIMSAYIFNNGIFNNYPIEKNYLKNNFHDIFLLGPQFNSSENKLFLKKCYILGITSIELIENSYKNILDKTDSNKFIIINENLEEICSSCNKKLTDNCCDKTKNIFLLKQLGSIDNLVALDPSVAYSKTINQKSEFKTQADKFQLSMKKEAVKLEFAEKREMYKKHMKQTKSTTSRNSKTSRNSLTSKSSKNSKNSETEKNN